MTDVLWQPSATIEALKERAQLLAAIRNYFAQENVMEVDTPALSNSATVDPFIESFASDYRVEGADDSVSCYLHTSPEFAMKRLLAAGSGDIYFLGHVFRNGDLSARHGPEFCMLEWYRLDFDLQQLMRDVASLLARVANVTKFEFVTYRSLFERFLDVNPHQACEDELVALVHKHIDVHLTGLTRNDCLDLLFSYQIEPHLGEPQDTRLSASFVYDYPESMSALAEIGESVNGEVVALRFEVFVGGCELANGYFELTDAKEQAARFAKAQSERKQLARPGLPSDKHLVAALEAGLPRCSGVALGVDRLLMLMLGAKAIAEVMPFEFTRA